MIQIACPHCQSAFEVDDEFVGQEAECPACAKPFVIEAPTSGAARKKIGLKKQDGPSATELAEHGALPGVQKSNLLDAAAHAGYSGPKLPEDEEKPKRTSNLHLKTNQGPTASELASRGSLGSGQWESKSVLEAAADAGYSAPPSPEDEAPSAKPKRPSNLHLKKDEGPTTSELAERAALGDGGKKKSGSVLESAGTAGYDGPPPGASGKHDPNLHLKKDRGPSSSELAVEAAMHSAVGAGAAGLADIDMDESEMSAPPVDSLAEHPVEPAEVPKPPRLKKYEPVEPRSTSGRAVFEQEPAPKKKFGCIGLLAAGMLLGAGGLAASLQLLG